MNQLKILGCAVGTDAALCKSLKQTLESRVDRCRVSEEELDYDRRNAQLRCESELSADEKTRALVLYTAQLADCIRKNGTIKTPWLGTLKPRYDLLDFVEGFIVIAIEMEFEDTAVFIDAFYANEAAAQKYAGIVNNAIARMAEYTKERGFSFA